MKLDQHEEGELEIQPTIRGQGGRRNLSKYRLNVLKHVLGFVHRRHHRDNEGWRKLIPYDTTLLERLEAVFVEIGVLRSDGRVCEADLERVADEPSVAALIDPLIDPYRGQVEAMIRGWVHDRHKDRRAYRLLDGRGGIFSGVMVRPDRVIATTGFRWGFDNGGSQGLTDESRGAFAWRYVTRDGRRPYHSRKS